MPAAITALEAPLDLEAIALAPDIIPSQPVLTDANLNEFVGSSPFLGQPETTHYHKKWYFRKELSGFMSNVIREPTQPKWLTSDPENVNLELEAIDAIRYPSGTGREKRGIK
jgi:hypothetical protein